MESRMPDGWYNQQTIKLVLQKDLHLRITGKYSGKVYEFQRAGDEQEVLEQDAIEFLKYRPGKSCCGNPPSSPYFDLA